MKRAVNVVVVGAGVMGLATAREVALRGTNVTLLEQFVVGHDRGSSHGNARVFKLTYPDAGSVRLAQRSLLLWRDLEEASDEQLLSVMSSIDVADSGELQRRHRALSCCGAQFEVLDGASVEERFGLSVGRSAQALMQPDGGVLVADRAQQALLNAALANGAELVEQARVSSLATDGRRVRVETTAGGFSAHAVVVTAGAWVRRLVEPYGLELDVETTRETVAYFRLQEASTTVPLSDWRPAPRGTVTYGIPTPDGRLKVGWSGSGRKADPDEGGLVDEDVVGHATQWAARCYGVDKSALVGAETCLYTSTPDEGFRLKSHGRLIVGSACSGHGFKFAPAIGKHLAGLALEAAAA